MDDSEPLDSLQPIQFWLQSSDTCEKAGDFLGACDTALLGLEQHPHARELQYRAILNLSRIGAHKRAQRLWYQYRLEPDLDRESFKGSLEENIAALGARLEREEAYASDEDCCALKLRKAAEHYEAIFRRTTSTFSGTNAAVLYELNGDAVRAGEIAAHIVEECARSSPHTQEEAYQLAADRAAASLLLNNLDDAQTAIEYAASLSISASAIASTRKQLIQICDHKQIGHDIISPLRNRSVIHYTGHMITPDGAVGRFPAEAEIGVTRRIQEDLANHDVGYAYGSLACGADTLIVERLLARRAEVNVILPCGTDGFLRESVANGGPKWLIRFDNCLKQVGVIHATDGECAGDPQVFAYSSHLAMGLAILRAQQLCADILQLAVWDGRETDDQAGTWRDIREWRKLGLQTITVSSEGNLTNDDREVPIRKFDPLSPPRKIEAILFGDFHGFSRLTDRQMLIFSTLVMQRIADVLDKYQNIVIRNTWGDGLFVVFSDLCSAARCALDIQAGLGTMDFASLGLPATLGLRLGLDAGALFEIRDPILKSPGFTGSHINRTARLEPRTPPGEVYVTETFAALLTVIEQKDLVCEYVGLMSAPKDYGRLRTYRLRRANVRSPEGRSPYA
ncbi:MAG: adenylate/guanylate cyclase domain-containing protein [Xanthobacteraceae bacterium]